MRALWYNGVHGADNLFERQVRMWKERGAHVIRNILKGTLRLSLFNP
jgi:hypothetical protein